jgi:hypothetical protein
MQRIKRYATSWAAWILIGLAGLACHEVGRWWPHPDPRPDLASPARPFPPKLLGPSPRDVIEFHNRLGHRSPPDVLDSPE